MQISGKTALVTGGAHRVGKAIVMMLAQACANVVVNYNSSAQAAAQTVDEAKALGVDAVAIQCNIANLEDVQHMRRQVEAHFGGVDILVNSADHFGKHPVPTDDYSTWRQVTGITIDGSFYVSNEFAPLMLARRRRHRQHRRSDRLAALAQFHSARCSQGGSPRHDPSTGAGTCAHCARQRHCARTRPAAAGLRRCTIGRRGQTHLAQTLGQRRRRRRCSPSI
ncbi:MAG: SDR family NAD(P)-dependent oxidoreductase [Caldilineaceae bacterium]